MRPFAIQPLRPHLLQSTLLLLLLLLWWLLLNRPRHTCELLLLADTHSLLLRLLL